jgi:hypothetical protein
MRTLRAIGTSIILMSAAVVVDACPGITSPGDSSNDGVELGGIVYATFSVNPANGNAPGIYSTPVAGAVVSTSLDAATATTDASGHFDLKTLTPRNTLTACQRYTLTITAAGHPTYSVTGAWGNGTSTNGVWALSPPVPSPIIVTACP